MKGAGCRRSPLNGPVEAVGKPFSRGCQNSRVVIERRRRNWTKTSARSRKTRSMTREALTVGCYDESSDNASCFCAKKNRFLRVFLQARLAGVEMDRRAQAIVHLLMGLEVGIWVAAGALVLLANFFSTETNERLLAP